MQQTIRRERKREFFLVIDTRGLRDVGISWKAKGILSYVMTLPDDWEIHVSELHRHAKDGKDSTLSGLNELYAAGYAYIAGQGRTTLGQFDKKVWIVYEVSRKPGRKDYRGRDMSHEDASDDFKPPWAGLELPFPGHADDRNGKPATENPPRKTRNGLSATGNPHLHNIELPSIDDRGTYEPNGVGVFFAGEETGKGYAINKRDIVDPSPVPAAPSPEQLHQEYQQRPVIELPDEPTAEDCYHHLVSLGTDFEKLTVRELLDADEVAGGCDEVLRMGFAHLMHQQFVGPMKFTWQRLRRQAKAQPGELASPLPVCERFACQVGAAKVVGWRKQLAKMGQWVNNQLIDDRRLDTSAAKTITLNNKPGTNGYTKTNHRSRPTTEGAVTYDEATLAARAFAASRRQEPE